MTVRRQHTDENIRNGINGRHNYVYDGAETAEDIRLSRDEVKYVQVKCTHCGDFKPNDEPTNRMKVDLAKLKTR